MPAKPPPPPPPPKCERCDETRHIELPDGRVARCPFCHPQTARSLIALIELAARLEADLARVREAIAEAEAAAEEPDRMVLAAGEAR